MTVGLFMLLYICGIVLLAYPTGLLINKFLRVYNASKGFIFIKGVAGISLLFLLIIVVYLFSLTWNKVLF